MYNAPELYHYCCRKSSILLKSLLGLKLQTFRPAIRACIHDWRRSKIFPIVLYHFDQNIILQSWLLYVVCVYDIFTRALTHTRTPTYKQTVEAAVAYNVITRVKSSGNGRWTMGGGGGECTARVLNKNRTTGKENLQQET